MIRVSENARTATPEQSAAAVKSINPNGTHLIIVTRFAISARNSSARHSDYTRAGLVPLTRVSSGIPFRHLFVSAKDKRHRKRLQSWTSTRIAHIISAAVRYCSSHWHFPAWLRIANRADSLRLMSVISRWVSLQTKPTWCVYNSRKHKRFNGVSIQWKCTRVISAQSSEKRACM